MIIGDSILNQLNNYKKLNNAGVGIELTEYPTYVERYYPITTDIDTYKLIDVQIYINNGNEYEWVSLNKKNFTLQTYSNYSSDNTWNINYHPNNIKTEEVKDVYVYNYSVEMDTTEYEYIQKYLYVQSIDKYTLPYTSSKSADLTTANNIYNHRVGFSFKIIYSKNNIVTEEIFNDFIQLPFFLSTYGWETYQYVFDYNIDEIIITLGEHYVEEYYHNNIQVEMGNPRYGLMATWYSIAAQNLIGAYTKFKLKNNNEDMFEFNLALTLSTVTSPIS